jgi:hypothetical protein
MDIDEEVGISYYLIAYLEQVNLFSDTEDY